MGADAYPSLATKAGALLHSLCNNHALVDGNKRIAAIITLVFLRLNGLNTDLDNDELFTLVMAVATGELNDPAHIGERLKVSR